MMHHIVKKIIKLYRHRQLKQLYDKFYREATIGSFFEVELGAGIKNESGDREKVRLGHHCRINGMLICKASGMLQIGDYSTIENGVTIQCLQQILIGNFSAVAGGVTIADNNTHAIGIENWIRHRLRVAPGGEGYPGLGNGWEHSESKPIIIGDGVWIGASSTILKGVRVGDGSIVARCSVVTKDVAPYTIVAGNPAQKVKDLPKPDKSIQDIAASILGQ